MGVGIQHALAENISTFISDSKDDCEICPKVSKNHIDRLINVLDNLDKQDNDLSALSIQNHKVKEEINGLSVNINTLEKPSLNSSICDFLYKYFVYLLFKFMVFNILIDFFYPLFSNLLDIFYELYWVKTLSVMFILANLSFLFDCPDWYWPPPYIEYDIGV